MNKFISLVFICTFVLFSSLSINDDINSYEREDNLEIETSEIPPFKSDISDNKITYYKCKDVNGDYYQLSEDLQEFTYFTCTDYGIQEYYELILAQMMCESKYVEGLVSETNDYGLMQINIMNHSWLSDELGIDDFSDSKNSIRAGIHIMSRYLRDYTESQALSKYNTGIAYDTTEYSRKVLNYKDNLVEIK